MTVRPLRREDRPALETLLVATGVFSGEEVGIALELIDIALDRDGQKDYIVETAVADDGAVVGYFCIGPTPATRGTYDLYWIAVAPDVHGTGVGKALLQEAERIVRSTGGYLLIAETSSRAAYDGTRAFYQRTQFLEAARIRDYYSVGDDLVVYAKYLS